jgi:phage terminase large subunit-like protein
MMSGKLRHGSPVLQWNGLNVSTATDPAGNIKPVKDVKRSNKIDGISATVDALSRIVGAPPPKGESYLTRGELVVLGA